MKAVIGLVLGAACAAVIACGGSKKAAQAPSAVTVPAAVGAEPTGAMAPDDPRARIEQLDQAITADLAKLELDRPAVPPTACIQPPCDTEATAAAAARPPTAADPTCTPGQSTVCKDTCTLSDSICDNAGKICEIAQDLGGNDAWANEKCASGIASCDAARKRCCGCV
jgi:hypothetical protein